MTEFSFYKLSKKLYFLNLLEKILRFQNDSKYAGVQSKNNEYHIVNKFENVFVYTYTFNLVDQVFFVLSMYSTMLPS
jgi:hypothetical protein